MKKIKEIFNYRKLWKQQKNRNKTLTKKINKMQTSIAEDLKLDITNDEIRKLKQQVNDLKNQVKKLNLENQKYFEISVDSQQENQKLKENYERIYNENCILREKHNISHIDLLDENYKLKQAIDRAIEYLNNVPNITAVVKIPNKPNEELLVGQTLYQKDIIELVKILGRYKGDNNE